MCAVLCQASKVMLKILQARLQQYVNLPDVQTGFTKAEGTKDQTENAHWIRKKARELKNKQLLLLH